ncbi:MAG: alpha/beta hydrolase [Desulfobacterales bacterium]|nr:alpha/beta hydrolase [Desulfobacterales bacterium]
MKKALLILIGIFFLLVSYAEAKDLVLLHGLTNKHRWGSSFLSKCLEKFGSGNVYAVYSDGSTNVWTKSINGRQLIGCGEDSYNAGDDSIAVQAANVQQCILKLQNQYGLSSTFNIIAHSMGGLVSRYYIYQHPNTVAGLVTLGTPHHGSYLATDTEFIGFFIGAQAAMDDLKPNACQSFNNLYPVMGAPLAAGGKVYTIGGDGDGWDCWGAMGELYLGWNILKIGHGQDSDGLVARGSEQITGATHIKTFWSYDHQDLVKKSDVATTALQYVSP